MAPPPKSLGSCRSLEAESQGWLPQQNICGRRGMFDWKIARGTLKTNFFPRRRGEVRRTEYVWRTLRGADSKRRLGRRGVTWHNGWFKPVNRNNILSRPKLECKVSG